ncbi:unnamed protein product [Rotaria sordida]|uniref:Uncharacterized protein n=1 Tax=Rotaria sordida TaxID=392033 RepID=A0A814BYV7_9BILA|nr:unnamed protein product [Rotaria sordida]CAF0988700.1 unnamed protein product [Rotaria sordida]CAF4008846.1 unnamed protein product [Rotaria sordida]CAF4116611.1 unnamed protein product [Rotaria sordida]
MTSSSNNILQNCSTETSVVSVPVSTNMIIGSPTVSIQNGLSSNISLDGSQQVENKNKIKRKLVTSIIKKKCTHHQNIISNPVAPSPMPSIPAPIAAEPLLHKVVRQVEGIHHEQGIQQVQNFPALQDVQHVSGGPQVQDALSLSHLNRFQSLLNLLVMHKHVTPFPPLSSDQNHGPITFSNENYTFPSFPSIPPQLSLLVKNVDLRLDFNEFCQEIKTRYPQVKNVIRLKNKLHNDIKLVKLELSSSTLREELLFKRKITVGYIVYDIDEYLAPANILICSKCMGLGHFMKQYTQVKSTCRTCGECADDLKLHICSNIEKCIHCEQNHKSNSLRCQVVKLFRSELTRKLLSSNNRSSFSTTDTLNNMSNSNFKYSTSDFPPMPIPQFLPTNPNNTMLTKLDDLLGKITEVNNHLSNLELKYNNFEQFTAEKKENDLLVKENLNVLSKQSVEFKKDLVHHSLLIERHENL